MGKVVAVIIGLVVIAAIVAVVALILNRRATRLETLERGLPVKGDLSAKQEQKLIAANQMAARIMHRMLTRPAGLTLDSTLLSSQDRTDIELWLVEHEHVAPSTIQKEINP